MRTPFLTILAVVLMSGLAQAAAAADATAQCKALENADFSGVTDAPTQVMTAELTQASQDIPTYCHVKGYIAQ